MMKSDPGSPFYRLSEALQNGPDGVSALLDPTPATAGPWSTEAQHGGPPAALLAWAIENLPEAFGSVVGRFTMELWGPVPLTRLRVAARVVRPGRSVRLAGE